MALIQCPECGKEISDKVMACPHCGYPFTDTQSQQQPDSPQPVEVTAINLSSKNPAWSRKIITGIIIAVCIILIAAIFIFVSKANAKKKAEEAALEARNTYIDNLVLARITMLSGGADAEGLCILTHDVWYNTIYEENDSTTNEYTRTSSGAFHDDFNDSLRLLYADENTQATISEIEENHDLVDSLMKSLQNPTEEFSACYDTVDALYDAYCGLTSLATSPSGSLTSYTENFREYDDAFMKYFEKLETQIPEKQELPAK